MYDFRMTLQETYRYLECEFLPERVSEYRGDLLDYALTSNTLTYVQRALRDKTAKEYPLPDGLHSPADLFKLLMERGVFVDLFSKQEVCDMTVAQFSRDDMLKYQGREEGHEEGFEEGEVTKLISQVVKKVRKGKAIDEIADELEMDIAEAEPIYEAVLRHAPDYDEKAIFEEL